MSSTDEAQSALASAQARFDQVRAERRALIEEQEAFRADIQGRKVANKAAYIEAENALIEAREAALDAEGRDKPADTVIG